MLTRRHEIEVLADTFDELAKTRARSALDLQASGKLDAAASVAAAEVTRRPALRRVALLLALEATELRLAGAVQVLTPRERWRASEAGFYGWACDAIAVTTFPEEVRFELDFEPEDAGCYVLRGDWKRAAKFDATVGEAVKALGRELSAYLSLIVRTEARRSA